VKHELLTNFALEKRPNGRPRRRPKECIKIKFDEKKCMKNIGQKTSWKMAAWGAEKEARWEVTLLFWLKTNTCMEDQVEIHVHY
jgi:hypothetical protein